MFATKIFKSEVILRLARLHIRKVKDDRFEVEPSNVHTFTVPVRNGAYEILIDSQVMLIPSTEIPMQIRRVSPGQWEVDSHLMQFVHQIDHTIFSKQAYLCRHLKALVECKLFYQVLVP